MLSVATLAMLPAIFVHRHLLADGCAFFVGLLESGDFSRWDLPRQHAHLLSQWPVVVAMALSVTDPQLLSWLYGAGLLLSSVIGLWFSWWLLRRRHPSALGWPLVGWSVLVSSTSLFCISESWFVVALFWPVLLMLMWEETALTRAESVLLVILSIALGRVYEGAFPAHAFLVVVATTRLRRRQQGGLGIEWGTALSAGLLLFATLSSLWVSLHPRDPGNRADAYVGIRLFLLRPEAWALVAGMVATTPGNRLRRAALGCMTILSVAVGVGPWLGAGGIRPNEDAAMRGLNVLLPMMLGGVMWLARRRPAWLRVAEPPRPMVVVLLIAACVRQAGLDVAWHRYVTRFDAVLAGNTGLVEPSEAGLSVHGFDWGWTAPTMSVVLQAIAHRPVNCLVKNAAVGGYAPWRVDDPATYPALDRVGVHYTPALVEAAAMAGRSGSAP